MDPSSNDGGRVKDLDLSTEVIAFVAPYSLTRVLYLKSLSRSYIELPDGLVFMSSYGTSIITC
jgi:hypothetical protein